MIDTEGQYTQMYGRIAKKYRSDIPNLEYIHKGMPLNDILTNYYHEASLQKIIIECVDKGESEMQYRLFPGVMDFVSDLRNHNVTCAIVTSSNRRKLGYVLKAIPELQTLFDKIFTAEDCCKSKPLPDCYLNAMQYYGNKINECVVFEDAINGLRAGMASGIFTIGLAMDIPAGILRVHCNYVLSGSKI